MAPLQIASPRKPVPPDPSPIPPFTPRPAPPSRISEHLSKPAASPREGFDVDEGQCESRRHRMLRLLVTCKGLGCEATELLRYGHEVSEAESGFLQALVNLSHHAASVSQADEAADSIGKKQGFAPAPSRNADRHTRFTHASSRPSDRHTRYTHATSRPSDGLSRYAHVFSRGSDRPSKYTAQSCRKAITRFKADDFIEAEKVRRRAAQLTLSTVELPRTKLGMALRASSGHYIVVVAQQSHFIVFDNWMLLDSLAATSENSSRTSVVFNIFYVAFLSSWAVSSVLSLLSIVWLPVSMLSATNAFDLFLDARFQVLEIPCNVILDIFCGTLSCVCVFQLCCIHWSVQRKIFKTHTTRLLTALVTLFGYAACAGTLLPNPHHRIYLVMRTVVGLCLFCSDSIFITLALRNEPKAYERRVGTREGKGWATWLALITISLLSAMDVCRHCLMMYACRELTIVTFSGGLEHPITGKQFGITNTQLADSMYIGTMFLTAQALATTLTTRLGEMTVIFNSQFTIG